MSTHNVRNLTGMRFGRLIVIERSLPNDTSNGSYKWLCKCDCGNTKVISGKHLKSGNTQSCGCISKEHWQRIVKENKGSNHNNFQDITGKKYGHLTVIKMVFKPDSKKTGGIYWLCKCDCGRKVIRFATTIKHGSNNQNCGCKNGESQIIGLEGRKFGKLRVMERIGRIKSRQSYKCLCDCGNIVVVSGHSLTQGNTKSCGCYRKEINNYIGGNTARNKKYGDYKLRARNIKVKFNLTVEEFEKLVILNCYYCGSKPSQVTMRGRNKKDKFVHHGIDRIDSSKGYTKDNCVPCCKICNIMKASLSQKEFYEHINKISKYNEGNHDEKTIINSTNGNGLLLFTQKQSDYIRGESN